MLRASVIRFSAVGHSKIKSQSKAAYYADIAREGLRHLYHGFRLFFLNTRLAWKYSRQLKAGVALTRRERQLLESATQDLLRLVPFSFFILVPFGELLLPVALKMFPDLIPSTFETESQGRNRAFSTAMGTLLARRRVMEYLLTSAFVTFNKEQQEVVRYCAMGEAVNAAKIRLIAPYFGPDGPFSVYNIPDNIAVSMAKTVGAYKTYHRVFPKKLVAPYMRRKIIRHYHKTREDDRFLSLEGLDDLTHEELIKANLVRGMRWTEDDEALRVQLEWWVSLGRDPEVPYNTLFWVKPTRYSIKESMRRLPVEQRRQLMGIQHLPESVRGNIETLFDTVDTAPTMDQGPKDADQIMEKVEDMNAKTKISDKDIAIQDVQISLGAYLTEVNVKRMFERICKDRAATECVTVADVIDFIGSETHYSSHVVSTVFDAFDQGRGTKAITESTLISIGARCREASKAHTKAVPQPSVAGDSSNKAGSSMEIEYAGMVGESTPFLEETPREVSCSDFAPSGSLCFSEYASTPAFLRSIFRAEGLTICVSEATVTTQWRLGRYFPRCCPPKTHCDRAVAFMRKNGLHLVADVDGVAGGQLLRAMTGVAPCASGSILANGVPVEAGVFRRVVGVVSGVESSMLNFTVEDNINFVIFMSKRVNQESRGNLVQAVCIITGLDRSKKAKLLSPSERFRLCLAMELARDPPIIVAYYPLDSLGHMEAAECGAVLKRVSSILQKTVIISCMSLPTHCFEIANTVLLFGRSGRVLYSGEAAAMPSYFNRLPCYRGGALEPSRSCEDPTCSFPTDANWRETDGSSKETTPRDMGETSFSRQSSGASPGVFANEYLVLTGYNALDIANVWAEDEATTTFYANFFNSFGRRGIIQLIERHSVPPQDDEDIRPFITSSTSQYNVLKPFFLLWYDILHVWRDPSAYIHLGSLAIGVLMISLLVHYQPDDQSGMYNIRGILFLLFLMTIMCNVESMADISSYLRLYIHQRESGLYNTLCFLIVFVFRAIIIRAVCLALFVPAVIYGLKMKALLLVLVGWVSLTHAFLCVAVHALLPRKSWAQVLIYIYAGYCVIFSGFLINLKSLPSFVGAVSMLRWGYGAALEQNLKDMPFSCDGAQSTSYCYTGNAYLEIEGFLEDSTSFSVTVMGVMCIVLLFVISIALVLRS